MKRAEMHDEREALREPLVAWAEVPLNLLAFVLLAIIVADFSLDLSAHWKSVIDSVNWFHLRGFHTLLPWPAPWIWAS